MAKYAGAPRLIEKEFEKKFDKDDFVFVCDMTDLFAQSVPTEYISQLFWYFKNSPAQFLLLTKNPHRYLEFHPDNINVVWGATIESNRDCCSYSAAPCNPNRIKAMIDLRAYNPLIRRFISIEPIMDFDFETFRIELECMKPWAVAVGYDNYNSNLPEPALEKTNQLIEELKRFTIVYVKTLREANRNG